MRLCPLKGRCATVASLRTIKCFKEVNGADQDAKKLYGLHRNTLLNWEKQGLLRPIKTPGGRRRYRKEDIERLLGMFGDELQKDSRRQFSMHGSPRANRRNTSRIRSKGSKDTPKRGVGATKSSRRLPAGSTRIAGDFKSCSTESRTAEWKGWSWNIRIAWLDSDPTTSKRSLREPAEGRVRRAEAF